MDEHRSSTVPHAKTHDGLTLDFDIQGAGPPLLLIAGLSADRGLWGYVRDELNKQFQTIAFDNRDVGKSDPASGPYGFDDLARDAMAVLDAAGVKKAHVLGHSMGGVIAQELAILAPERLQSLIVSNSYSRNDLHTTEHFKLASALRKHIDHDHTFISAMYFYGLGRSTLSQMPLSGVAEAVLDSGPMQQREGFIRQCDVLLTTDTADRISAITAPTMVFFSPQDKIFTKEQSLSIAEAITGATIEDIAETGHCPMVENPSAFIEQVSRFVSAHAA
jgi:pimeloyl-ACP methyl ester carboxylesterase